jgi:hypothetical protein
MMCLEKTVCKFVNQLINKKQDHGNTKSKQDTANFRRQL